MVYTRDKVDLASGKVLKSVDLGGSLPSMGEGGGAVKAFTMGLSTGIFDTKPVSRPTFSAPVSMPGGFLTLSLDQDHPDGSQIVWVVHPDGDATLGLSYGTASVKKKIVLEALLNLLCRLWPTEKCLWQPFRIEFQFMACMRDAPSPQPLALSGRSHIPLKR